MSGKFDMDDYVPVNERIDAFYAKHPEGSLQSEIVLELTTESRIAIRAYAYRTPDDPRPGTGLSWLEVPGSTSFTRGSEIENCETSAWGRAIAALGFEVKRGVASQEEVRNKQPGQGAKAVRRTAAPAPVQYRREELANLMAEKHLDNDAVLTYAAALGIPQDERPMTNVSMDRLIEALQSHGTSQELQMEQPAEDPPAAGEPEAAAVPAAAPAATPKARTVEEAIADAEAKAKAGAAA